MAAVNDTLPGLTMYYRDCNLSDDRIARYRADLTVLERGFTDVSSFAEGMRHNLRFSIASNKAVAMGTINPEVAKYGFCLISAPAYFRVLDVYAVGDKTQVLLLHFAAEHLDVMRRLRTSKDQEIIDAGRRSLDAKLRMPPSEVLHEPFWLQRTAHPIGMGDDGALFPVNESKAAPEASRPASDSVTKPMDRRAGDRKRGFWRTWFG